jgi:siroheme synthase
VSAAVAAAGLAHIPVTHRGVSSGFVVVSGHAEEGYRSILDTLAPHAATLVVLMGLGHIDAIARLLIARGWTALTPAAVLFAASTPRAAVWTSTLADLQHGLDVADRADAGTIVIGDVVRLRAALAMGGEMPVAAVQ